ncbi:MAG TPA: hypothetical protein PLA85_02590 [Micropepsaceae bacterium]|nr:hypothetical protein [Micropepsaceae bacterium]
MEPFLQSVQDYIWRAIAVFGGIIVLIFTFLFGAAIAAPALDRAFTLECHEVEMCRAYGGTWSSGLGECSEEQLD